MACNYKAILNPFTSRLQLVATSVQVQSGESLTPAEVLAKASVADVPADTRTTVVTINAAVDTFITKIVGSGEDHAQWVLVVDTVDQNFKNSDDYGREWNFTHPWKIPAGSILDLKVEHPMTGEQLDFAGTIWGYT